MSGKGSAAFCGLGVRAVELYKGLGSDNDACEASKSVKPARRGDWFCPIGD